jgi:hypothetical protein
MALFHLLVSGVIGLLPGCLLMFFVLLGLEFLPFFVLVGLQFVLLLLVFFVQVRVSRVRSRRPFAARDIFRMNDWPSVATFGTGACFSGSSFAAALEFTGASCCNDAWPTVVGSEALLWVGASSLDMRGLCCYGADVPVTSGGLFFTGGARVDSAVAVVTHVRIVSDVNSGVVDVVDHIDVDVIDCGVVEEMSAVPASAFVAVPEIAETVVNTAIEADCRAPKTSGEREAGAVPSPPGWSPKEADFGSNYPCAGNPEVVAGIVIVIPVAGRPDITIAGANGLIVNRKYGRRDGDRYANLGVRGGRYHQHYNCEQHRTSEKSKTHGASSWPVVLRLPGVAAVQRAARTERLIRLTCFYMA